MFENVRRNLMLVTIVKRGQTHWGSRAWVKEVALSLLFFPKRGNLDEGKQVKFQETTIGFPQNDVFMWNEHKNSILITFHYQDLYMYCICSSSKIGHTMREICFNLLGIKSTSQIRSTWVVTSHQYGITPLLLQTSFHRETSLFFKVTPFKSQQFCRWW